MAERHDPLDPEAGRGQQRLNEFFGRRGGQVGEQTRWVTHTRST
jgi:hypothetical protein